MEKRKAGWSLPNPKPKARGAWEDSGLSQRQGPLVLGLAETTVEAA